MLLREGEEAHNYPKGYKEKPWCPYTELVNICADLVGEKLSPETFCTERLENPVYPDGSIHYLKSGDFYPEASCAKINHLLSGQMGIAARVINLPSEQGLEQKLMNAKSISHQVDIIHSYQKTKELYKTKQLILDRWRNVVFENCCKTTADEKNPRFRQLKSPSDLSEDEIINRVEQFKKALQKITGYRSSEAEKCPQSPHFRHYSVGGIGTQTE